MASLSMAPSPSLDVSDFVGDWTQHAGDLNIHSDGTIDLTYQVSQGTFLPLFPQLKLRIVSVAGNKATAAVLSSDDPNAPVGSTFSLELKKPGIILTNPLGGEHHWCDRAHRDAGD